MALTRSFVRICLTIALVLLPWTQGFAPSSQRRTPVNTERVSSREQPPQQPLSYIKDQTSDIAAFVETATSSSSFSSTTASNLALLQESLLPVLSTSLLITGNTVGASMLVLPELAQGPGMGISTCVLVGAYAMNWLSGLCIAQVAIHQYETSGNQVPSSFKEFAETNLPGVASLVSGISIFVNSLVLAFDTTKAGQVLTTISGDAAVPQETAIVAWAALMLGVVATLSLERLSQVASLMVVGVFISFAGLVLPGLAHVADPLAVLTSSPSSSADSLDNLASSILHMTPVFVTTLVYQNIVPTVTRILGYDRIKVLAAISLGSFLPLLIYLAWCVAVLGGGIESSSSGSVLFTIFSMVTVAGSSMGALMSLSEEFEIVLEQPKSETNFSWPSVALPSMLALGVCQVFSQDISGALQVAGSYGSPLLYGVIPVTMAYFQQQQASSTTTTTTIQPTPTKIMPGGRAGLGVLGAGALALVGTELMDTLGHAVVI